MAIVIFKPQGRLGNYLWECAVALVYSIKHNIEFSAPFETNDEKWNPVYFPHLINNKLRSGQSDILIQEKTYFKYDEIEWKEEWRGKQILLEGYWQNWQYIDGYRSEILQAFKLSYKRKEGYVAVHVRRGDYLKLREKHPEVTKEWYENAMNQFSGYKFLFGSDEIDWCKKEFGHRSDCEFLENGNELTDLVSLSECEHQINSASTFSLWASYLNQNETKRCIFPKQWMTPAHSNQWTEEIVRKEWERI